MLDVNEGLIGILIATSTLKPSEAPSLNSWWSSGRVDDETLGAFLIGQGVFIEGASRVLDLCQKGYLKIDDPSSLLHLEGPQRLRKGLELATRPAIQDLPHGSLAPVDLAGWFPKVGETLGGCLLTGKIGGGASGTVFRAWHADLRIAVAVKVPPMGAGLAALAEFESKARRVSRLDHPRVVKVLGYDDTPVPHLILELVQGTSLLTLIGQVGRLQVEQAVLILLQMAQALKAFTDLGMAPGFVSPANILLSPDGAAKLVDYGLEEEAATDREAKDKEKNRLDLAEVGAFEPYQAPERAGGTPLDLRSALYALGATFYHAVTGSPPSPSNPRARGLGKSRLHLQRGGSPLLPPRTLVPELHPAISDLILRLMAESPEDRFDDVSTVIAILEAFARSALDFEDRDWSQPPRAKRTRSH